MSKEHRWQGVGTLSRLHDNGLTCAVKWDSGRSAHRVETNICPVCCLLHSKPCYPSRVHTFDSVLGDEHSARCTADWTAQSSCPTSSSRRCVLKLAPQSFLGICVRNHVEIEALAECGVIELCNHAGGRVIGGGVPYHRQQHCITNEKHHKQQWQQRSCRVGLATWQTAA